MKMSCCLNPVEKFMGVLFAYRAKSTGLAPPVFISRRIVVGFFLIYIEESNYNAMKVRIKGSVNGHECYEF